MDRSLPGRLLAPQLLTHARWRKHAFMLTLSMAIFVFGVLSLCHGNAQTQPGPGRRPVLVELFTSEGCSTCPAADALLERLMREQPVHTANIIVLGEHVDYWDQQGWHDRFSSPQFTARQREYGSRFKVADIYTPQMVVAGADQFVGNDGPRALRAIAAAAQTATLNLSLSKPAVDGRRVSASVSIAPAASSTQVSADIKGDTKADVYAALVDPEDTTEVLHGENGGHRLQHVGVVRTMQRIGSLEDLRSGPRIFNLSAPENIAPATMQLVVFVQRNGPGAVLGAVSAAIAP